MSNLLKKFSIGFLTFIILFAWSGLLPYQKLEAKICTIETSHGTIEYEVDDSEPCNSEGTDVLQVGTKSDGEAGLGFVSEWVLEGLGLISIAILKIASFITYLGGMALNSAVYYTVVNMSDNIDNIGTIDLAWSTIRDLANMGFIFILLYAAIRKIIGTGGDTQRLVVMVVVIAILINFSLFFTRLVIDASNVLAIAFYDSIAPGALSSSDASIGISSSLMEPLGMQNLWNPGQIWDTITSFEGERLLLVGLMGTIISLIAAFVFFAVAIMFVIRFVVLIFALILSPIAFMASVLPQLQKYRTQWWDALSGQAFFAPIYFLLTWIVIVIARGLPTNPESWSALTGIAGESGALAPPPTEAVEMLISYFIIIALLITSLVIAKEWSNKAGPAVTGLTKWATGVAGGASFGLAGRAGRYTLGAGTEAFSKSKLYKRMEAASPTSMRARLALSAIDKTKRSSFDIRGTGIGGAIAGPVGGAGKAQEGGFEADWKATREFLEREGTESHKKRRERAETAENELKIEAGSKTGATAVQIADMEKAMAKMSDKQVEAIVDSNRKLLDRQTFANALSVKQLETLNKSEKLSETEKNTLKDKRFATIITAMAPNGAGAGAVSSDIKALSDTELDMINPDYLRNSGFVRELRGGQAEYIQNKSTKITRRQKDDFKTTRRQPLDGAITAGNAALAQDELRKFSPKEVVALGMPTITNPLVLAGYTPNMLKRMATEMNTADIQALRALLTATFPAGTDTGDWLRDPDTGMVDFS